MSAQLQSSIANRVSEILLEYAQADTSKLSIVPSLSIRNDLAIDSLSLVSIVIKIGDACGVDVVEAGLDLTSLLTVEELVSLATALNSKTRSIA